MNTATSITLHTIYQMHVPTANALIESYGTNKIKSQLTTQSVGAILEDVTLLFRAYLGDLIPGRSEHDAKLREISICKDLVRQHIESLRDTGRTIGQLPESLPVAEDYTNAFTYLIALVDSINTQAPDNTMLKNSYHTMGWDYPEFQTFLAERHGADLPTFLGVLAASISGSDYSRMQAMTPANYRSWTSTGEAVYALLFNAEGRGPALVKALRAELDLIVGPYYSRRTCIDMLPIMANTLLRIEDAEALVAAGWTEKHSDCIYAALGDSAMFREGRGRRVAAVEVQTVQFNLARLGAVICDKQSKAKAETARKLKEEQDAIDLETRKAQAAARLALLDKIKAGTVTAAELDAAGY